jgi:hypothetical protein
LVFLRLVDLYCAYLYPVPPFFGVPQTGRNLLGLLKFCFPSSLVLYRLVGILPGVLLSNLL